MKTTTGFIVCLLISGAIPALATSMSAVDYAWPQPPNINDHTPRGLTTNLLELKLINTKAPDPASPTNWNLVKNGNFIAPSTRSFAVTANGKSISVSSVYFKRRPFYGPLLPRDLRPENSLYLLLAGPVAYGPVRSSEESPVAISRPMVLRWRGGLDQALFGL